jgi:hypothetical protein
MFAVVVVDTPLVVTENVVLLPAFGTVTVAGTVAAALSLVREIVTPFAGATLLIVTVPRAPTPPTTELGLRLTAVSVGCGRTVNVLE